jgi:predicted DNA-binding transcriptional regulator YafY
MTSEDEAKYFLNKLERGAFMADIPQVERQLYILSLLSENSRGYSIEEILSNLQRLDIDVTSFLNLKFLDIIREAITETKTLRIDYNSFNNNKTTQRKFNPYFLEVYEGCWHLVGYCHLRNSIRDLKVSRIKEIMITNEQFDRKDNFYEDDKKQKFDKLSGQGSIKLKLKFNPDAARFVKEYEKYKDDQISECKDGSIVFERITTISPEVVKWVLGYGSSVEIIEPLCLKEDIKKEIKKLCITYAV